ncbi:hypothetical protein J3Q64DRAFT_1763281 [Phycomyces blakesleeanus]|uniref:RRM domain-containing protein n=1 Tax=Phycomyces blakesleeanus TaxID=4837 RepID=A0ABR3APW8_PHYBL
MNVVKEIQRINLREINNGEWSDTASWHAQYSDTAWVFGGNIPFDLTEGDIICIFSQYGEIINVELIRDQKTGKSRGFAFIQYADQRSTILAVDNLNGGTVLDRTLRVDHSYGPKRHKKEGEEEDPELYQKMNAAPPMIEVEEESERSEQSDVDSEDPMAAYFKNKNKKKSKSKSKKSKKKSKDRVEKKEKTYRPHHVTR